MKALVFTPNSLFRFSNFSITDPWFDHFGLPEKTYGLKRVVIDDIVYLIELDLEEDNDPIIVINIEGENSILKHGTPRQSVFERISTVARRLYTPNVLIPDSWRPHYEGTIWSIYATNRERGGGARIHFQTRIGPANDLFAFALTEGVLDFDKIPRNRGIYNAARQNFDEAILSSDTEIASESSRAGIVLSNRLPQGFVPGAGIEEWYDTKLTEEQREFVDKPYDGPVRLRGSAGTGKTLALVIKFLRDGQIFQKNKSTMRLGFLTHSESSVELVNSIATSLDHTGLLYRRDGFCTLEVRTIYHLAHAHLHFDLNALSPLSLDGQEGRRMQYELIETVLEEMWSSPIVRAQYSDMSEEIMNRWEISARKDNPSFVKDIMNEFASVLDADGIRAGEERGERYAKANENERPAWLMTLPNEIDKRFILEAHRRYRRMLGEMNTLSVDQMIADFNSFLDSNRWDRIREREGYDALFVDELHLFTSIERQTLHKLIKRTSDEEGKPKRPPIFMAYDLKQSPRDTFTQYGEADNNLFTRRTGLQNSDLVKLSKVFRYTPEIAEFLEDLDASFPAIDIPGDWDAYAGDAQLDNGKKPDLLVFKDELALFKKIFNEASRIAQRSSGGGRRVAILCPSEEMFDRYLSPVSGQFRGKALTISSREPVSELRHVGKRFIFSMPEYVAGLQFDTVFLIHVDATEAPNDAALGTRRRFISNVYLGSSRAEKTLHISSCNTRGGPSDVLSLALSRNTLIETVE